MDPARTLEIWIDRGGTFTDAIARFPDGRIQTLKLLSRRAVDAEDSAVAAIRALARDHDGPLVVKMGTTVATNALLERKGARTLLMVTRGFADALAIGHQARPDIFALHIKVRQQLAERVLEVDERIGADGAVVRPLDAAPMRDALAEALADGFEAVAILLMHAWRNPAHEQALAALARQVGFAQVSASHEVSPLVRFVPRGDTTVADATLSPALLAHVRALERAFPAATILFMQSNGGLAASSAFRGRDAILSGPAGGIVGMAHVGRAHGFERMVGFDMGGTSTDVSHVAGRFVHAGETEIAGVRIQSPMLDIHTVAAGGGSICRLESGRLLVGPQSAGAMPGPACYGLGGPLTITDCNLALGRLRPEHFPRAFGPAGDQPIDCDAAHAALARLADAVAAEGQPRPDPLALAEGLVAIANTHMASAIRRISIARGHDPATHALVAFGGAGGQHACALAEALGIATILVHPMAGLLSALGIGIADLLVARERMLDLPLRPETDAAVAAEARALEAEALAALLAQGVPLAATRTGLRAHVRYEGSDTAIDLPLAPANELARAFAAAHQARFGFTSPETPLRIERLTAEARGEPPGRHALDGDPAVPAAPAAPAPAARARMRIDGRDHEALVLRREALAAGDRVAGPALVADSGATTLVAPGWTALVADDGTLILTRAACSAVARVGAADDPARLELHHARFMGIATDMGAALQASARSVNMKERLDFSCALFDAAGRLVANAPHIPVHLGAMGASVQAIAAARAADGRGMRPGDVYALNTPWNGGSHLPDITVVQPCFVAGRVSPAFFVAARGHHADIGGITPGSMPPLSRHIDEEGVLLDNVLLVEGGRLREAEMRALLASGPWPARNPERNIADLVAQVAACARGAEALGQLAAAEGLDTVLDAMRRVQDNAAEAVRRLIDRLGDGEAELPLDNGAVVRVAVRVDRPRRRLRVDFAGTSPLQGDNCNAPVSVTRAALLYVLRAMVDAPIPLNDGALEPVELVIPEGSLLAARHPSAVVAGNVETSQIVTDALFLALGAMAAAQGTMNNLTFGDGIHQYYETIAGGTGAGPGFDGASAVQSHMTNSRLTDPEILELRHPVRVERFAIRRGSGGPGAWRGGDGVVRRLAFLAPMTVALLSGRRRHAPPGLAGGAPGLPGEGWILRAGGAREPFGPTAVAEVHPGDEVEILTPGGGGYGPLP